MLERRAFLRGLTALPLIGGSVAIIGRPTAAAVPITRDLKLSYKAWLFFEHRMLSYELAGYDGARAHDIERSFFPNTPGDEFHFRHSRQGARGPAGWLDAPQPSTRAAIVLSAVGCPLKGDDDA